MMELTEQQRKILSRWFSEDLERERQRRQAREKKRESTGNWTAPEHARLCSDMRRDRAGNLLLDPRPEIMRPRPKPFAF